jgi:sugar-specific transcriptional regulator TrmB
MVASTEVLDALKSIGLNLYERKIFVSLLAKGVATAAELSEIAKVPRSRSYDILESLADKGFVLVQPSKPIRYVALKPTEALERVKEKLQKDSEEMIARIERISNSSIMSELESIYKQGLSFVQPEEISGTLKSKAMINRQLSAIFKSAKKEINLITTDKGLRELYNNHFRILKKKSKSGVKIKIIAPSIDNEAGKAFADIAELRRISSPVGRVYIVDNEHTLVALTDDKVHETQDVAFWANSQHATRDVLKPLFNQLWVGGKK